ncbi:myo-inositol 2-dehydrogenase / D-chiro-inositol 1-dehydrogenase [Paracoccus alcaliphilus]|uniref:Myo-inositol 2-dehydrogenase / D-chiro-inositol 1-dehydrogenase n=1 Tax=Paracoccus alcaliphilus TaxID=34002 RepID=A0A1H8FXX0_9RHOB|nr:inositol 2-dehydrogenase [Paracoccus alcaliphilus]WCR20259.1 inositol 2-dehydrogenase [Paracoccus alcaliphilus]SEN36681.1 myo-inositol 2-dehydrogenase / D-chiro-inositol 1-dehydrogenase [Paracoccus alcaliphilus]
MTGIAVLGTGRIGRMHAENIAAHPRARLAGVYDIHGPSAQEVARKLGVTQFDSVEAVLGSDDVDAVLIASSTATHADLIEQAVAAGKAILCEKPIDLSLDRVNACAAKIAGSQLPIMLGFVRRLDSGHAGVRRAIESGRIGDLHQVIITSRDPGMAPDAYIEVSGGIFRDMTIHDFDMARFILGEEVTEVSATGSRLVDPALMERCDDYDTVTVVLKTASGKQAIINNSRRAVYGYDQRVEAFGSAGMAISDNHALDHVRLYGEGFTDRAAALKDFFIERYDEAFAAEIDAFVDAVEQGKPVPISFEDGRQALILAEAAIRSAAEGRTVKTAEIG